MDSNSEALGVYVSVPFCRAKCSFCNFASGVSGRAAIEAYIKQLCAEIDVAGETAAALGARLPRRVDSVYFGGGTPSLLTPAQLGEIFAALRRGFAVEAGAEMTLEAAPGQIAGEVLDAAMRLGINRVSLGVQSFVDRESAAVGRTHTEQECVAEIARLKVAGLQEVGADLIAGLPYQTHESWRYSLDVAGVVGLTHLSVYMLEVDEDSRLGREVLGGGLRLHAPKVPGEEMSAELYEMACERLPAAGFSQYEISNFAAQGHPAGVHESRHNRKYWERKPYMGFGLDAHSMLPADGGAVRFANGDQLAAYGGGPCEVTRVDENAALEESLFLGLRLREGVAVSALRERFGKKVDACEEAVREMVEGGMMTDDGKRWTLTPRGGMISNVVFGRLLEGVGVE